MQVKTVAPANVCNHAAGVLQMKPLALISINGFDVHFSTSIAQANVFCHHLAAKAGDA